MRTKIRSRYVIGFDGQDHVVYENGELVYEGDRVLYAGLSFDGRVDRVIEAGNSIVSPGFLDLNALADIDTTVMTYDQPLHFGAAMGWSEEYLQAGPKELGDQEEEAFKSSYALTQLIFNGITTAFPVTSLTYRAWAESKEEFARIAHIAADLGLRVYLGPSYRSGVHVVRADGSRYRYWDEERGINGLKEAVEFIQEYDGAFNGLVRGLLVPSTVETCTADLLRKTRLWSDELKVPVRLHAAQSYREFQLIKKDHGKTPIQYLEDIGFLSERVILPHAIYINGYSRADCGEGPDREILRDRGLIVVHCPFALARAGVVMESFERFKDFGINLSIGTDCFPSDMLMNLRLGSILCRVVEGTQGVGKTSDMFRAATIWPANWLGRQDLGRLTEGSKADFFIASLDGYHIGQLDDPIRTFILNGNSTDIKTVVIDGKVVMDNRSIPGVNTWEYSKRAQQYYEKLKQSFSGRDYLHRSSHDLFPLGFRVFRNYSESEM
ncbi:MAG: chlorohydrolase family protein [Candidatus Methanomethylicaceae archaeon]